MIRTWWAVVAVLAILAMHGLATHASSHPAAPTTAATAYADLASDADHPMDHAVTADSSEHGEPGHEMTVLSLCLAVLATAAVLLVQAVRPRSGLLAVLPSAVATPTGPVVVRLHAPPDLHALSVLRC